MIVGLTRLVAAAPRPETMPRLWIVMFFEGRGTPWWAHAFRKGFRHVSAASYYADIGKWVYYDPSRVGTVLHVYDDGAFPLDDLLMEATVAVRARSQFARRGTPACWHCVGAIKALLGLESRALGPYGLFRDLLRNGAEIIEVPHGRSVLPETPAATADPAGGPGSCAAARA